MEQAEDFSQLLSNYQKVATELNPQASGLVEQRHSNSRPHHRTSFNGGGAYKCITCDYSFRSREMLFNHLSTHVTCDHEDCGYVGVAQAVAKHKREEHEESESVQVFSMEHPAILEAWLEERRKNFPSSGNLKLKELREQAKIDHGIIARVKSYTFKDKKWGVKRHKPCIPDSKEKFVKPKENDPLSFILNSDSNSKETGSNLLGLGAYNSSSDSETENTPSKPAEESETLPDPPNVKMTLRKFKRYAKMRGTEGKRRKKNVKWNGIMKSGRRRHQPTLLYKLLSKDITREHNTALQCIRYVVSNNFFNKIQREEESASSITCKSEPMNSLPSESLASQPTPENQVTPESQITPENILTPESQITPENQVTPDGQMTPENQVTAESQVIPENRVTPFS